jgi:hypothetical protein
VTTPELFSRRDEGAHDPGPEPLWSETCAFAWWDDSAGIGGMHHIGQFVNRGEANWWHGLVTREGECYRSWSQAAPLEPGYRGPDRLQAAPGMALTFPDGGSEVEFGDAQTDVRLRFSDYYPVCESRERDSGGDIETTTSPNHFESSGSAAGNVRLRDRVIDVRDARYHRDHSWGVRDYSRVLGHRWIVGTAGPQLSFCAVAIVGPANFVARGFVVRDGVREQARGVDIAVSLGPDGTSVRSAAVLLDLPDRSRIELDCRPAGGFLWGQNDWLTTDQIGTFATSAGLTGMTCIETSLNTRDGKGPVRLAAEVATRDGFSKPHRGMLASHDFAGAPA